MNFYEVAVDSKGLKGHDTLTYSYEQKLPLGSVVRIDMRGKKTNGIVTRTVKKPGYKTKAVTTLIEPAAIAPHLLELTKWLADYYATDLSVATSLLLPRGAHKKRREKQLSVGTTRQSSTARLTREQTDALKQLRQTTHTAIVHGVTGSGKTRIYMERAKDMQKQGLGSIILVPEIGLTEQITADFRANFDEVFVLHSQQTESVRHQQWLAILRAKAPVVVGPRSALFSPVHKLGLVVVDESHEPSYKQDQSPKYNTTRVAAKLTQLTKAQLLLGSATPSVEDVFLAQRTNSPIVRLSSPVHKDTHTVDTAIVDLRDKDILAEGSRIFSKRLITAIETALAQSQQVLLFHNRRGSSTSVICKNCGWLADCPTCQLPLTHHADWQKLVCHVCNHREAIRSSCPQCKQAELQYRGIGTKQIESDMKKLFPKANIARFDSDNKTDERLHERYYELHSGKVDIIVGTQSIAKGLDLPKLRTVGVIMADVSLHLPDYSAAERTFQLLYQVMGRVGRHQDGDVIVQTYSPEHPAIQNALKRNYQAFYDNEIAERKLTTYPPFAFLLKLECVRKTERGAIAAAESLAHELQGHKVLVLGPSPAFHERTQGGGYRWQIVLKSKDRTRLQMIAKNLPANWQFELDPINLL